MTRSNNSRKGKQRCGRECIFCNGIRDKKERREGKRLERTRGDE